ncbi:MAG: DUF1501 domain-containing protein [Gemmataceae bacterium]
MLTFTGRPVKYCDGLRRREFLKVGTFAFGAASLTLADTFRLQAANPAQNSSSHKSIINIFLGGGPPHQDTFDLKMDAPSEIRGEMKPIDTTVPGMQICEVFPQLAKMAKKFSLVRSIVGAQGGHDAYQCTTGFPENSLAVLGGRPSIGSVLAKLVGPVDPSVPPFIGLSEKTAHTPWSDPGRVGFLGPTASAFKPSGPDLANMKLNAVNRTQLTDRKNLLESFDNIKRTLDSSGGIAGYDAAMDRALNVLTSSKLVDALDISKEDPKVRERYGDGKPYQFQYDGAPTANDHLLMARRLVQAGARCVTLSFGRWDSHGKNFDLVRDHGKKLDQALSALFWDLDRTGLFDDTCVVVWGEFGRTPRINKEAGRDHWPQVSCALIAGSGINGGQVVGATNRLGEFAKERPVTFGDMFATIYKSMGMNPETTTVNDQTGRPQHIVEGQAIKELI